MPAYQAESRRDDPESITIIAIDTYNNRASRYTNHFVDGMSVLKLSDEHELGWH